MHSLQGKGVANFHDTCSRHNKKSEMYQLWEPEMHMLSVISLYYTEMPTSGNLKSGDSLFGIYYNYEVLHEVQTITIRSYDCNGKIIFVIDEICALNIIWEIWWPVQETVRWVTNPGQLVCMYDYM